MAGEIKTEITGNKLTVQIELDPKPPASASGKTVLLASSHGPLVLSNGAKFSFNIYRKA